MVDSRNFKVQNLKFWTLRLKAPLEQVIKTSPGNQFQTFTTWLKKKWPSVISSSNTVTPSVTLVKKIRDI